MSVVASDKQLYCEVTVAQLHDVLLETTDHTMYLGDPPLKITVSAQDSEGGAQGQGGRESHKQCMHCAAVIIHGCSCCFLLPFPFVYMRASVYVLHVCVHVCACVRMCVCVRSCVCACVLHVFAENTFSALSSLPFTWKILDAECKPSSSASSKLRLVTFDEVDYDVQADIAELEAKVCAGRGSGVVV